ncbi:xaa-Arg dipeptidase-like [Dysidea avara]|uniref:xaa-Arg dipeptidase-like n=1 Tax=Dysidea avara TaxID=196820 RepID=UPI00331B150C
MGTEFKSRANLEIERYSQELNKVGEEIWSNPELGFEEYKAHEILTDFLEQKGFHVDRSYLGISTAFRATFENQAKTSNICVVCEYDALPEIGHACGHNLIAEAGIAAGLGIKAALEGNGAPKGRITVMGTPAEEGLGGKVKLIEKGAFDDVDVAMMAHPCPTNILEPVCPAIVQVEVTFNGKAAHAAAFPWEGINALDAAILAYNNVSVLRQQLKPTIRIHGIITNGGAKPNIIPEQSAMEYCIRATKRKEVLELMPKVIACFEAAAKATGCTVDVKEPHPSYDDMVHNKVVSRLYKTNSEKLGMTFVESPEPKGSTDMGNVSHMIPAIQPGYHIGDGTQVNHTRDFTTVANMPMAYLNTLTVAKAMAMTAIDLFVNPELLQQAKKFFNEKAQFL